MSGAREFRFVSSSVATKNNPSALAISLSTLSTELPKVTLSPSVHSPVSLEARCVSFYYGICPDRVFTPRVVSKQCSTQPIFRFEARYFGPRQHTTPSPYAIYIPESKSWCDSQRSCATVGPVRQRRFRERGETGLGEGNSDEPLVTSTFHRPVVLPYMLGAELPTTDRPSFPPAGKIGGGVGCFSFFFSLCSPSRTFIPLRPRLGSLPAPSLFISILARVLFSVSV